MPKYKTTYDAIGEATAVDGVIDVTPDVAAALNLGDPIGESEPVAHVSGQPVTQDQAIAALLAMKAEDVIPKIAEAPAERVDALKALREAEDSPKGKKRSTVLKAIDARLAEIEAEIASKATADAEAAAAGAGDQKPAE
jgi:hypothetical protein